ncbi:MAG: hypothetical protein IJW76_09545 [Clostridia bacterium]|nr:hypothetical protein [Clostridia bacterium]
MSAVIAYTVEIILLIWVAKIIFNFVRAIVLRVRFYIKLKNICAEKGYILTKNRALFASFFGISKKSDITVSTGSTRYSVRLLTCFAHKRAYHFINESYYIRFARFGYILPMSKNINKIHFFESIKKMPLLSREQDDDTRQILLLNPSPAEVFQLEGNRMKKSLVRDGAEMYGWNVYGAKGFLDFLTEK